ncbi:PI31 proteasome regulator [Ophiocordyceps camponoti-floridani]|uniref:PI31 proteasome regulator n=1 Tax=Ophiocordyceps camponoti-floridani TaxID=2030778 RepID=A0A8H4Q7Y7_9HYPO|nr:PI31 proteasome regulator [Ophiocordyceps camponoti-floridani]
MPPSGPQAWPSGGALTFFYADAKLTVRVDGLGPLLHVRIFAEGARRVVTLERRVADLVRGEGLPVRVPEEEHDKSAYLIAKLRAVFVSEKAMTDFANDLTRTMTDEIFPNRQTPSTLLQETQPQPDPYEIPTTKQKQQQRQRQQRQTPSPQRITPRQTTSRPQASTTSSTSPAPVLQGYPTPSSLSHRPRRPQPPGLGPRDPLRPFMDPRPDHHSGMIPSFDDFLRPHIDPEEVDTQPPPGARWDPLGPGGAPRFPPPGSGRFPGPGGNFFGGGGGII